MLYTPSHSWDCEPAYRSGCTFADFGEVDKAEWIALCVEDGWANEDGEPASPEYKEIVRPWLYGFEKTFDSDTPFDELLPELAEYCGVM